MFSMSMYVQLEHIIERIGLKPHLVRDQPMENVCWVIAVQFLRNCCKLHVLILHRMDICCWCRLKVWLNVLVFRVCRFRFQIAFSLQHASVDWAGAAKSAVPLQCVASMLPRQLMQLRAERGNCTIEREESKSGQSDKVRRRGVIQERQWEDKERKRTALLHRYLRELRLISRVQFLPTLRHAALETRRQRRRGPKRILDQQQLQAWLEGV